MDSSDIGFLVAGLPEKVRELEERGLFKEAILLLRNILRDRHALPALLTSRLQWEFERIERTKNDYRLSREEAHQILSAVIPDLGRNDFDKWLQEGTIESREIEGQVRIFNSFLPNLLRDSAEAKRRAVQSDEASANADRVLREHIENVLEKGSGDQNECRNTVSMVLRLKPDVVPDGETVRAWIPFPLREPIQTEIELVSARPDSYVLAPEDTPQRTIYFEQAAKSGQESRFEVHYEYTVSASYRSADSQHVEPYIRDQIYEQYTSEQLPHVAFTPYLEKLAEEIVADESNPYLKAWRIYDWITKNVRYALVPEYSTFECISDYAARNLRGDCGIQALLFITLCRISGIPARWQSGWYLNPSRSSPHDWAQCLIEPYGWLYVDPSFGGHMKDKPEYHRFYFGNIDHFRLITNIDISSKFSPEKIHYRSDTVDNQRGEMEWKEANLYFDKWDYQMKLLSHQVA